MALTKDEIVKAVVEETGFPKNQSAELVETLARNYQEDLGIR